MGLVTASVLWAWLPLLFCYIGGPLYLIIEFAVHGSLKDFLQECRETIVQLNHSAINMSKKTSHSSTSTNSSCAYPALREKIPLSQQNSVFSTSSEVAKSDLPSPCYQNFVSTDLINSLRMHSTTSQLSAQDSGFFGGESVKTRTSTSSQEYVNNTGLLYMEDVQNFAVQIAQGLQHLESLNVSSSSYYNLLSHDLILSNFIRLMLMILIQ